MFTATLKPYKVTTTQRRLEIYAKDRDDAIAFIKRIYRKRIGEIVSASSREKRDAE